MKKLQFHLTGESKYKGKWMLKGHQPEQWEIPCEKIFQWEMASLFLSKQTNKQKKDKREDIYIFRRSVIAGWKWNAGLTQFPHLAWY